MFLCVYPCVCVCVQPKLSSGPVLHILVPYLLMPAGGAVTQPTVYLHREINDVILKKNKILTALSVHLEPLKSTLFANVPYHH